MLPLLFSAFTLAVLPLVSTRAAAALLVLNYLPLIKGIQGIAFPKRALTFSILATIALITASLISKNLPTSLNLLQWIILIWSVPLFSALVNKYGQRQLISIFLVIVCLHSIWGIGQFIMQRDLGLTRLGESHINIYEPAVAKINVSFPPFKLLRAYGPYKHANSFAGVLVLGLSLIPLLSVTKKISWSRAPLTPGVRESQTPGVFPTRQGSDQGWLVSPIIFFILTLALFTTFSRAAIYSFLLIIIFNAKIFFKKKYFLLLAIIVLTFMPLMVSRFSFTRESDKAIPERINSVQWASEIIKQNNFWQGTGIGHYPNALKNYLDSRSITYQPWQIDFVHSVPILLVAEWGIVPILFLVLGLLITNYGLRLPLVTGYLPVRQAGWLRVPILFLLTLAPIFLTDHYFVTQLSPAIFLLLTLSLHSPAAQPVLLQTPTVAPGQK